MTASRPSSRTPDTAREHEADDRSREDEQRYGKAECDADAEARESGHDDVKRKTESVKRDSGALRDFVLRFTFYGLRFTPEYNPRP